MPKANSKTNYIQSLNSAMQVVNNTNNQTDSDDNVYFTYFTAMGVITGKEMKIDYYNSLEEEPLEKQVEEKIKNGTFHAYGLADALLYSTLKAEKELNQDLEVYDQDKVIILEDVVINDYQGNKYTTPHFVLFSDQVIGLIPGKSS